jgi:hypothetical protein
MLVVLQDLPASSRHLLAPRALARTLVHDSAGVCVARARLLRAWKGGASVT